MRRAARLGRITASISSLAHDRRGGTLIEFAICSAAFFAMLLGALQISLIYFGQQIVQTAAERVARQVMTGELKPSTMSQTAFRQKACDTMDKYKYIFNCDRLLVDMRTASDFDALDTGEVTITRDGDGNVTNGWSYNAGGPGSVVILRLYYTWKTVAGPLNMSLSNQGSGDRLLIGTMVFKSEIYR